MTSVSSIQANPNKPEAPPRTKYRVRFAKAGDLRLVSHHDLMHVCERMFRRADLSIPVTQGFNPRPRMWFALSLALGVAGLHEILEFELTDPMSDDEVRSRLRAQAPPGLDILSVRTIDVRAAARVRRAIYAMPLYGPNLSASDGPFAGAQARTESFMTRTECWVERKRPNLRRVNVRPFVHELAVRDDRLIMAMWITDNGSARPDEVVTALGLAELLEAGAVIERTDLEVYDELPAGTEGPPPITAAVEEISSNDRELPQHRPTAIVDSPMSFDS